MENISFYEGDLIWLDVFLLWVNLVNLRELHTHLLHTLSRTGHPTPKPTPWATCLCHIQFQYNITNACRGIHLIWTTGARNIIHRNTTRENEWSLLLWTSDGHVFDQTKA
jgi:hypothetical protein